MVLKKIDLIYSLRDLKKEAFRDVVYEYEDYISEKYGIQLVNVKKLSAWDDQTSVLKKVRNKIDLWVPFRKCNPNRPFALAILTVNKDVLYFQRKNCVPVFCDIWNNNLDFVAKKMRLGALFFVTSMDVYERLKQLDSRLNIRYIPLSVSDKWVANQTNKNSNRIIQVGRKNTLLHEWALQYVKENPKIEYVYTSYNVTMGNLEYVNTEGKVIGTAETRKEYINLLSSARISLVSSPGIDTEDVTRLGISFPTPRFYESVAVGCEMIGRYADNQEFKKQKIGMVCPNIASYEEFKENADRIFEGNYNNEVQRQEFIQMHKTSTWIQELLEQIEKAL